MVGVLRQRARDGQRFVERGRGEFEVGFGGHVEVGGVEDLGRHRLLDRQVSGVEPAARVVEVGGQLGMLASDLLQAFHAPLHQRVEVAAQQRELGAPAALDALIDQHHGA